MNTTSSFRTILMLYGFFVARIGQRPFEPCRAESRLLILKNPEIPVRRASVSYQTQPRLSGCDPDALPPL